MLRLASVKRLPRRSRVIDSSTLQMLCHIVGENLEALSDKIVLSRDGGVLTLTLPAHPACTGKAYFVGHGVIFANTHGLSRARKEVFGSHVSHLLRATAFGLFLEKSQNQGGK